MPLYDVDRHEALRALAWDERKVRATIERIVRDTERRFDAERYWTAHPLDDEDPARVVTPLYHGACGVIWALHYLAGTGAVAPVRSFADELDTLLSRNRKWLGRAAEQDRASFLMGDTPILLLAHASNPGAALEDSLAALIAGNVDHPSRELMWGAPGTLLAALFLHERMGGERWAELFRTTAAHLWDQLERSQRYGCRYWTQELYGWRTTYLGAAHGFAGVALPLIRGRHLLPPGRWSNWERCIVETMERGAERAGVLANWRLHFDDTRDAAKRLLQICHGAPGIVVCLADLPSRALDDLLVAAGEAIWAAGPLAKGSNLCHGTGGNGYAFLKLYRRTGDACWLERARAFAMHGIAQMEADAARFGQLRYSLWTGDPGFAIYLWDCVRARACFPTLDVFDGVE